jgi:hypothetical protein
VSEARRPPEEEHISAAAAARYVVYQQNVRSHEPAGDVYPGHYVLMEIWYVTQGCLAHLTVYLRLQQARLSRRLRRHA